MRHSLISVFFVVLTAAGSVFSLQSPALGQEKQILELTENNWVAFRDYNGRQLIYFTHLEAWKCGIAQVSYSLNSDALDQIYELQPCDRKNPNAVTTDKPYISLPLGTAQSISVQITYADGTTSEVMRKTP